MEANRRHWDEIVPIHVESRFYDVAGFREGQSKLKPVEREELGDVRGQSLLHLQCHFGLDTLSWAREGAAVTGVDFSERAIEVARALAGETGISASFVEADIYELPERLEGQFDIVFTSYGVLCWLPDIGRWSRVAAHFVRPGGTFYMVEYHPFAGVFDDAAGVAGLHVRYPYFPSGEPLRFEDDGSYADTTAKIENRVTHEWPHPLSEVVTALIEAGLGIDFVHEFAFTTDVFCPFMEEKGDGSVRLKEHDGSVPLLFSIKASKPADRP